MCESDEFSQYFQHDTTSHGILLNGLLGLSIGALGFDSSSIPARHACFRGARGTLLRIHFVHDYSFSYAT